MSKSNRGPILWSHPHAPWSPWTNSGASRAICLELRSRGLIEAALGPDLLSRLYARSPGLGYEQLLRLKGKWPKLFGRPQKWNTENDGAIGKWLNRMPDNSSVVYVFSMPKPSPKLNVHRYLFLNLSMDDAVRTGTFGYMKISNQQYKDVRQQQTDMLSWVDGVVTPSTYAAESIARDFDYPRELITAFGYGATMSLDSLPEPTIDRYAAANILFIGRDWKRKGGPLVYEAFKNVRKKIPHATLTIIGPNNPPIMEDGIRFVGFIDKTTPTGKKKLISEYGKASVFCMPTYCEPWGLVFSEAASAGLPIVSFRQWSLPDIVIDGESGRLIDDNNANTLAGALIEVLVEPERALVMGLAATRRAMNVLTWPRCVDRLLSIVRPQAVNSRTIIPLQNNAFSENDKQQLEDVVKPC